MAPVPLPDWSDSNVRQTESYNITLESCLALQEKGIVHRDLSPNNIMLGDADHVTVTDFGLAKQKQQDVSKMTSVVGTILYSW